MEQKPSSPPPLKEPNRQARKQRAIRLRTCCSIIFLGMFILLLVAGLAVHNFLQARQTFWEAKKQQAANAVLAEAYPRATLLEVQASRTTQEPFDYDLLAAKVIFEAPDPFDAVRTWYVQHPKGGNCGMREEGFPKCGLIDLTAGKTRYEVDYTIYIECKDLSAPMWIDCLDDINVPIP